MKTGIYQMKLEVQDDDGIWSSQTATNFKIIDNSAPCVILFIHMKIQFIHLIRR